jgi:hypothetical protein
MATVLAPATPPPDFEVMRFTVDDYERMIASGTIAEDDRVELLDGWIVAKMPHNAPHDSSVNRLQRRLMRLLGDEWLVRGQSSARLDTSVPEPDLAVVPGPEERYDTRRPRPVDLQMVAEVADSSLARDRGQKLRMYARNRVRVYWIVNLRERVIEVYTLPRGGKSPTYRQCDVYAHGQTVPVVVGGRTLGSLSVSELLP